MDSENLCALYQSGASASQVEETSGRAALE